MNVSTMHERIAGEEPAPASSDRAFGYLFAGFFAAISAWSLWSGRWHWYAWLILCLALIAVSLGRPALLHRPNQLWLRFAHLVSRITTPVVVGIMFYGVIMPLGLLMRMVGKRDPLRLRFEPQSDSYWIERIPPGPAPESIKHQF
jgi:hypothetical protein